MSSTLGTVGASVLGKIRTVNSKENQEKQKNKIRVYKTLGRTGFRVSDIALGGTTPESVIAVALDRGINYFDTGEDYGNGTSEKNIGKAIQGRDRKKVFITTKMMLKNDSTKENILNRARKCLERLNTDYIDCLMIQNATDIKIIDNEGFHAAVDQLKNEGRIRFAGITSHGTAWYKNDITLMTNTMEKVCFAAAESGRFDVFLFIYNFMATGSGERILQVCKEKNIGATLMKINPVHNYTALQEDIEELKKQGKEVPSGWKEALPEFKAMVERAGDFIKEHNLSNPHDVTTAAVKFVFNNPGVHTVCCAVSNFEKLEFWLSLSGSALSTKDKDTLDAYENNLGNLYCRHACGVCEINCPDQVPINAIMRYNHYFSAQKREKYAMGKYDKLPTAKANLCTQCEGLCESACPYGVSIHKLLMLAHRRLTLV